MMQYLITGPSIEEGYYTIIEQDDNIETFAKRVTKLAFEGLLMYGGVFIVDEDWVESHPQKIIKNK